MLPPLLVLEYNLIFIHVIHIAEKSCEDRFRVASRILKKPAVYRVLPGSLLQSLRIREHGGKLELTTKHSSRDANGENNEEFEFLADPVEYDRAVAFFHALGHEDYFVKTKDGWEWQADDAHIELLSVNDLGYFAEIEILIPFDADERVADECGKKVLSLLSSLGLAECVERRAYRDMILERRSHGMES